MLLVEASSSTSVSPTFRRESPSYSIAFAALTSLSCTRPQEGHLEHALRQVQMQRITAVHAYTCRFCEPAYFQRSADLSFQGIAESSNGSLEDSSSKKPLPFFYWVVLISNKFIIRSNIMSNLVVYISFLIILMCKFLLYLCQALSALFLNALLFPCCIATLKTPCITSLLFLAFQHCTLPLFRLKM